MKSSRKISVILCFLSIIMAYGCGNHNKKEEEKIPGHVAINSDSLGFVREMLISKNFLVLLDKKPLNDDNQLWVYDLKSLRFLYSFGRIGRGPGEFQQGMSLNKINDEVGGFTLLDLSSYKLLLYEPNGKGKFAYSKAIQLLQGHPYMPIMVNDKTIFSLGLDLFSGRFAVYDKTGKMTNSLGDLPPAKKENAPMPAYEQACKGLIRMTPDKKKLVVSYQFANVIDIYNEKGELLKRILGDKNKSPKYNVTMRNGYPVMMIDEENASWGYLDIQVTNNNIVALFSGKPVANANFQSNEIFVYDLHGQLEKKCKLDRDVSQIALDTNDNKLLAIDLFSKPKVYSFDLSKILNRPF